ncbi:HNH endonuclease signature motif containing protein [Chromatocurvus halotolerans]|nr:HNH endonuclease signature motif containing protein [Chromatocurvus halotolerans]
MHALVGNGGHRLDGVQLGQAIALLSAQINSANHRLLQMIAEFDRCGGWRAGGAMRSCAHWLAARCGISLGAAREKVRVARQLTVLPEISEAFSGGGISYSKVRAITRVATPENEGFMVNLAEQNSAGHLERLVGRYEPVPEPGLAGLLDLASEEIEPAAQAPEAQSGPGSSDDARCSDAPPALDAEAARELARELWWFQDEDGMWIIHARLPPEQGQLVMKALQAVARPLEEARQDEWKAKQQARMQAVARKILQRREVQAVESTDSQSRSQCGARAQAQSSDEQAASKNSAGEPLPDHLAYARAEERISAETFSQHMNQIRADALMNMVEHFLATGPDCRGLQALKGAERCQVVMHVDLNTLREQRSGMCCTHGRAHYEDKPWLSPTIARRVSCDASLVTVLEDDAGKVLNVGRRSRIVPEHIRRALRERDGVCQYPGCQESEFVDAHHIRHWAEGGETRLDNLVTLCRFHHRQLHRGCFDIRLNGDSAEIVT